MASHLLCTLNFEFCTSARQRIGPELHLVNLARRPLARFHVKWRTRADGGPQAAPLPARLRIVDAAVQPLGVEAERIGHANHDPLAVLEREQSFRRVAGVDRRVRAKTGGIKLIDPGVIAAFNAAAVFHAAELRHRLGMQGPALGAMLSGGFRTVERPLARAAIEAGEGPARERGPAHAVAVDVAAARPEAGPTPD